MNTRAGKLQGFELPRGCLMTTGVILTVIGVGWVLAPILWRKVSGSWVQAPILHPIAMDG
jgi:hypothetical protein